MLKGALAVLLLALAIFIIAFVVVFRFVWRGFKPSKTAAEKAAEEEEYFKRTSTKYRNKDEAPKFDKDYFKGNGGKKRPQEPRQQQRRQTTTTSGGVTIIDERTPEVTSRKIFRHDEGEYVDYVEE